MTFSWPSSPMQISFDLSVCRSAGASAVICAVAGQLAAAAPASSSAGSAAASRRRRSRWKGLRISLLLTADTAYEPANRWGSRHSSGIVVVLAGVALAGGRALRTCPPGAEHQVEVLGATQIEHGRGSPAGPAQAAQLALEAPALELQLAQQLVGLRRVQRGAELARGARPAGLHRRQLAG